MAVVLILFSQVSMYKYNFTHGARHMWWEALLIRKVHPGTYISADFDFFVTVFVCSPWPRCQWNRQR